MYYLPDCVTIFKKKGSKITSHSQYTDYEKLLNEYLLILMNQNLSTPLSTPEFEQTLASTPFRLQTLNTKKFDKFIDDLPFTKKKVQEKVNERRQFYRLLMNDSPYSFYFKEVIEKILKECGEYREQYTWNDIFSINFILKIEGEEESQTEPRRETLESKTKEFG